jgi:hypothetical protein
MLPLYPAGAGCGIWTQLKGGLRWTSSSTVVVSAAWFLYPKGCVLCAVCCVLCAVCCVLCVVYVEVVCAHNPQPFLAGNFGDVVQRLGAAGSASLGSNAVTCGFTVRCRRGQYAVLQPKDAGTPLLRHPLQPLPTDTTKGVFVFPTLYVPLAPGVVVVERLDGGSG